MATITDEELLRIVKDEKNNAIGLDDGNNSDLHAARSRALKYYKGHMEDDQPSLHNRSSQVSYDVADGIEQAIPDIVEIFLQEDVVSFEPIGPDDEEAAKQEGDYVSHVFFKDNDGFKVLSNGIKDSLREKTGYFYWYFEEGKEPKEQTFEDQSYLDVLNAMKANQNDLNSEVVDVFLEGLENEGIEYSKNGEEKEPKLTPVTSMQDLAQSGKVDLNTARFRYTIREKAPEGHVCVKNWTPSDVAVSQDTMTLGEGTYCVFRSRMRRQDLLVDGYDPDLVDLIPRAGVARHDIDYARDTVGEHQWEGGGNTAHMDMVEVFYHYVRIFNEDTKELELWNIVTGGDDDRVIMRKEVVDYVPASMITPFPVPHRFFGESMADKLIPIQQVKTSLTRIMLDQAYFALNQRPEVSEMHVSKHTMTDLLKNEPGQPIRVKMPGGINPVQTAPINFDPGATLEYFSTQGEQRSGVARSSMGLNPDTLHESGQAALAQLSVAQRRTRFMARGFAETGIKALFLGIHRCLRENASSARIARLNGKYVSVNPASWRIRENMNVEIGTTGGREFDVANLMNVAQLQQSAVTAQGGIDGPLVKAQNLLETAHAIASRSGIKTSEKYFPDPTQVQQQPPQDPSQSPEAMKMQAELAAKTQQAQMTIQANMQVEQAKVTSNEAIQQARIQADQQVRLAQLQVDDANRKSELQLAAFKAKADLDLAREGNYLKAQADAGKLQATVDHNQMQAGLKNDQINAEISLKAQIADTEAQLEALRLKLDDENSKLSILADQETAQSSNMQIEPTDVHLTTVHLGGEPG